MMNRWKFGWPPFSSLSLYCIWVSRVSELWAQSRGKNVDYSLRAPQPATATTHTISSPLLLPGLNQAKIMLIQTFSFIAATAIELVDDDDYMRRDLGARGVELSLWVSERASKTSTQRYTSFIGAMEREERASRSSAGSGRDSSIRHCFRLFSLSSSFRYFINTHTHTLTHSLSLACTH